jgi:hypothetical protein
MKEIFLEYNDIKRFSCEFTTSTCRNPAKTSSECQELKFMKECPKKLLFFTKWMI